MPVFVDVDTMYVMQLPGVMASFFKFKLVNLIDARLRGQDHQFFSVDGCLLLFALFLCLTLKACQACASF